MTRAELEKHLDDRINRIPKEELSYIKNLLTKEQAEVMSEFEQKFYIIGHHDGTFLL